MFILILELNNILEFNISKHISQLLFIYATTNICNLLYHAFTPFCVSYDSQFVAISCNYIYRVVEFFVCKLQLATQKLFVDFRGLRQLLRSNLMPIICELTLHIDFTFDWTLFILLKLGPILLTSSHLHSFFITFAICKL